MTNDKNNHEEKTNEALNIERKSWPPEGHQRFEDTERVRQNTDTKLQHERLVKQEELKIRDEFVAVVSHDLRNPLAALQLHVRLIRQDIPKGEPGARVIRRLDAIQRVMVSMNRMIETLLDSHQIAQGEMPLHHRESDAVVDIDHIIEEMLPLAQHKGLLFDAIIPEKPCLAWYDPDRIKQVIVNLVGNAIKFSTPGTTITITAKKAGHDDSLVRFEVYNEGPHIPEDQRLKIFERFMKITNGLAHAGTGLGLWIARWIVEAHGGKIWVESIPNDGNTFVFTLPRHAVKVHE